MRSTRGSRRASLAAFGAVATVLVGVATAWACTSFQTIKPSLDVGEPGTVVSVTGAGAKAGGAVELRWDSRTAPVAATADADESGAFQASIVVPDVSRGVHVILATDSAGQLARAAFEVVPAAGVGVAGGLAADTGSTVRVSESRETGPELVRTGLVVTALALAVGVPVGTLATLAWRRPPAPAPAPATGAGSRPAGAATHR